MKEFKAFFKDSKFSPGFIFSNLKKSDYEDIQKAALFNIQLDQA